MNERVMSSDPGPAWFGDLSWIVMSYVFVLMNSLGIS